MESIGEKEQDHQSMRDAYDQLYQKHSELSSQTVLQAQHTPGLEVNTYAHTQTCYII